MSNLLARTWSARRLSDNSVIDGDSTLHCSLDSVSSLRAGQSSRQNLINSSSAGLAVAATSRLEEQPDFSMPEATIEDHPRQRGPGSMYNQWFDFDKVSGRHVCKLCDVREPLRTRSVSKDINGGTTSRRRHLKSLHPDILPATSRKPITIESGQTTISQSFNLVAAEHKSYGKFDMNVFYNKLCLAWLDMRLPFEYIENKYLEDALSYMFGSYFKLCTAETLKSKMSALYQTERAKLKDLIAHAPGKISLMLDVWTAPNQLPVLRITGHFLTADWKLVDVLLSARQLSFSHNGANMAQALFTALQELGCVSKILCLTTDNALSDTKLVKAFIELLVESQGDTGFSGNHHVPCIAHVVNSAAQDALKILGHVGDRQHSLDLPSAASLPAGTPHDRQQKVTDTAISPDEAAELPMDDSSSSSEPDLTSADFERLREQFADFLGEGEVDSDTASVQDVSYPMACPGISGTTSSGDMALMRQTKRLHVGSAQEKVRAWAKAIQDIPTVREYWDFHCTRLNVDSTLIPLDVKTRWHSSLIMAQAAIKKRDVLRAMFYSVSGQHDKLQIISEEEWDLLEKFVYMMIPFSLLTNAVSTTTSITASKFVRHFCQLTSIIHTRQEDIDSDGELSHLVDAIESKLNKYVIKLRERWPLAIAVVLDPRFKAKNIKPFDLGSVRACITALMVPIIESTENAASRASSTADKRRKTGHSSLEDSASCDFDELFGFTAQLEKESSLSSGNAELMLNRYLQEPVAPQTIDPLEWWKQYGVPNHPVLATIAQSYLSIQASSVASERAFSRGKLIYTDLRNRMSRATLERQMCLSSWVQCTGLSEL